MGTGSRIGRFVCGSSEGSSLSRPAVTFASPDAHPARPTATVIASTHGRSLFEVLIGPHLRRRFLTMLVPAPTPPGSSSRSDSTPRSLGSNTNRLEPEGSSRSKGRSGRKETRGGNGGRSHGLCRSRDAPRREAGRPDGPRSRDLPFLEPGWAREP